MPTVHCYIATAIGTVCRLLVHVLNATLTAYSVGMYNISIDIYIYTVDLCMLVHTTVCVAAAQLS